ncbi:hypothetical protein [Thiocapsa marina]|uniref:Uncharacterized protein n=1 Tax=Thiocapsa marina 5811 TaxID=768671 RepID=F9UHY9_9GAMM|nr:hypothetical protein [Thiocapsa marina]EGV16165.1 hypothetical protein ThimaDRAFT_4542 [Thiocapsa marina 5811]
MEFFATARLLATPDQLRDRITGPRLADCCDAIDRVLDWREDLDAGEIYCLWGQFEVRREPIRGGVRFTLPGCPNALAWTVTAESDAVIVHCTINRTEHDPDFIESIETFVEDWRVGLERPGLTARETL